jgi:hypothetical protein
MTGRRGGLVCACLLAALVAGGCSVVQQMGGQDIQRDVQVSVAPEELLVRFPAVANSWACTGGGAGGRQYAWTVRMDNGDPWYGIAVRATLPASAPDPGRTISPILEFAQPSISRMTGSPPRASEAGDTTSVTAFAVGDTALVLRVTDRAAIRRVARGRPLNAQLIACVDGNDRWTREVAVTYDPRF